LIPPLDEAGIALLEDGKTIQSILTSDTTAPSDEHPTIITIPKRCLEKKHKKKHKKHKKRDKKKKKKEDRTSSES